MKLFIIGSGNMATALGRAFRKNGHIITGVHSRNKSTGRTLARSFMCPFILSISSIPPDADVYLVAVNDDSIASVSRALPRLGGVVAHTSGSTPINVLGKRRRGVFYPLESVSINRKISFKKVPVCIEGSDAAARKILMKLAKTISGNCHFINSRDRAILHLGAVMVNNFTNHLMRTTFEVTGTKATRNKLLRSLAESTIEHAFSDGPVKSQTGPARRGDIKTIRKHLAMLKTNAAAKNMYKLFTSQIMNKYNV